MSRANFAPSASRVMISGGATPPWIASTNSGEAVIMVVANVQLTMETAARSVTGLVACGGRRDRATLPAPNRIGSIDVFPWQCAK